MLRAQERERIQSDARQNVIQSENRPNIRIINKRIAAKSVAAQPTALSLYVKERDRAGGFSGGVGVREKSRATSAAR